MGKLRNLLGTLTVGALMLGALMLTGCAGSIPADPEGTLDRVQGDTLRVGVTENPPWVELNEGVEPSGSEPELVRAFATQLDAEISWTTGSEATLLEALDQDELDIVLGGFLDDTPWVELGSITRAYAETKTADGVEKHVMIVRLGENGFLVALEAFLFEAGSR